MNAATIQDFGSQSLSEPITTERLRESTKGTRLTVYGGSDIWSLGIRTNSGREMEPMGMAEPVHAHLSIQIVPTIRFFGGKDIHPRSIAESVKDLAVSASSSLSPSLRPRISELANLKADWDGEGAKPVKSHVLADAVETLKRLSLFAKDFHEPFIAPTFDGFLQLEWHGVKRSLDIEAVDKGWTAVGTLVESDGNRYYHTANFERNDFPQVAKFYQWFWGDELIWPSL